LDSRCWYICPQTRTATKKLTKERQNILGIANVYVRRGNMLNTIKYITIAKFLGGKIVATDRAVEFSLPDTIFLIYCKVFLR